MYYEDNADTGTLEQIQQMFAQDTFFADLMIGSQFEAPAAHLADSDQI